jgi:hypothetical protein
MFVKDIKGRKYACNGMQISWKNLIKKKANKEDHDVHPSIIE